MNQIVLQNPNLQYTHYIDRVGCSLVSQLSISDHSFVYIYRKTSSDLKSEDHSFISYRNFFKNLVAKIFEMNFSTILVFQ